MTYETSSTITYVASFLITAVAIVVLGVAICRNVMVISDHYFSTMNHCIDVGGSWVPARDSTAACIINNR